MNIREFEQRFSGKIHHKAVFTMKDGSKTEGYAQPNDQEYVYLTSLDGASGGKVHIEDILLH
jgi:hypothetical protein